MYIYLYIIQVLYFGVNKWVSDCCLTSEWLLFDLWVIIVWPLSDCCLTSEWFTLRNRMQLVLIITDKLFTCCQTTITQRSNNNHSEVKQRSLRGQTTITQRSKKCNHIIIYFILYKIFAFLQLSVLYTHFPFSNYWKIIFILKTTKNTHIEN
jgi:hypothetical protein